MTNKEWLATVDSQKWYSVVHCWLFHEYGKRFDNTYLAVLEWLDKKHTIQDESI